MSTAGSASHVNSSTPLPDDGPTVVWVGLRGFPGVQGGIETHAEHLCPLLVELGCRVTAITRGLPKKGSDPISHN